MAASRSSSLLPASPPYALILRQGKKSPGVTKPIWLTELKAMSRFTSVSARQTSAPTDNMARYDALQTAKESCAEETTWAAER